MKKLYCPECGNYLEGGDGEMRDCYCGWSQPEDASPAEYSNKWQYTDNAHTVIEELLNALDKLVYKDCGGNYLTGLHGDSVVTGEVERAIELAKEYLKTEGEE